MEDNFVYATVYEQNLWIEKSSGRNITICNDCGNQIYIDELTDGYCTKCEAPLGDAHGDLIEGSDVEFACWDYLKTINDKATLTTKALHIVQDIIDNKEDIDITDILKQLEKNKYHVGFSHQIFDESFGYPVENTCIRENIEIFGKNYEKITWKAGFILSDFLFEKCKNGEIVGYSFGGSGMQSPLKMKETINEETA